MTWNPNIISQGEIHALREAAERAWGDDTRNEAYRGSQRRSAGQCYNTSRWLQKRLGGSVGRIEGHYVWLSPDQSHVIDLTGDQFGKDQILYKPVTHDLFASVRPVDPEEYDDKSTSIFSSRADREFDNLGSRTSKIALDYAGDAFPAEEPQTSADIDQRYWHHEPSTQGNRGEYKFVYANGHLEISPFHDHEELASHAGADLNGSGPLAAGYVSVDVGVANWSMASNVGAKALSKVLKDYTDQVGWKWGGLTDLEGEPIGTGSEFAPKKSEFRCFAYVDGHLYIGLHPPDMVRQAAERGADEDAFARGVHGTLKHSGDQLIPTVYVGSNFLLSKDRPTLEGLIEALTSYGDDIGLTLVAGDGAGGVGNNVVKRIEDLELDNIYSPEQHQKEQPFFPTNDEREPSGANRCPDCGRLCPTWRAYTTHRLDHEPPGDDSESGGFPEIDMDSTFPTHFTEQQPEVFPIAHIAEAERCDGFKTFASSFGFDDTDLHYVAFLHGCAVGFATVSRDGELKTSYVNRPVTHHIINKIRQHFPELYVRGGNFSKEWLHHAQFVPVKEGLWKYSAGSDPKDMLEAEVPFIFDVQNDTLSVGEPGTKTSEVPGEFTPGGIVEGTYEPGGKVYVRSLTTIPYTVRHLIDLWYWTYPYLEVKNVYLRDAEGKEQKLAAQTTPDIGTFIRTRVAADPAVAQATRVLQHAGGRVFAVGGAVRDAILGKEPNDIDLMVQGIPGEKVRKALESLPGRVDYTGKDFGVFRLNLGGHEVEVALPRREKSTGPKHTDFDVQSDHTANPEEDLYRRDFTANAMAVDLGNGALIDPYGGAQDIAENRLKTVHEHALAEDPLRVVRALTARARHGLEPDEGTRAQMVVNAQSLPHLPTERISEELMKIMEADDPAAAIRLAHETGSLGHILPEVENAMDFDQNNPHHEQKLGDHLLSVLERTSKLTRDPDVRLAALLHDIGKPSSAWPDPVTGLNHFYEGPNGEGANHEEVGADMVRDRLTSLKGFPANRADRVERLVRNHMFPWFETTKGARRFINQVGDDAEDLLNLREADNGGKTAVYDPRGNLPAIDKQREMIHDVRTQAAPTDRSMLAINGNDLVALGLQGPQIGQELEALTNLVVDDPSLNDRDTLLKMIQEQL